jgi:putative sugar O-methyltransferase
MTDSPLAADDLHPGLCDYLSRLGELSTSYEPSLFWQRELRGLAEAAGMSDLSRVRAQDVARLVAASQYAMEPLPQGTAGPESDKRYRHTLAAIRRARRADRANTPAAHGLDREEWRHGRGLLLLAERGELDNYLEFLGRLGVRSSHRAAWNYWYLLELERLAARHGPARGLDIVEIGPGSGMLACFLYRRGLVRRYTMIDLAEMVVISGYTIARYCGDAALTFNELCPEEPAFSLLSAQDAGQVPDECADLVLNVSSFMEMDRSVRDDYISLLYRASRPGALFYNVNRRQRALPQPDGDTFDNNPLLYPYRPDDRVLLWEEDDFQQAVRARFNEVPSLAVKRAAIVKSGS